jgi:hypothetical protein
MCSPSLNTKASYKSKIVFNTISYLAQFLVSFLSLEVKMNFYFFKMRYQFKDIESNRNQVDDSGIPRYFTLALSKDVKITKLSFIIFRMPEAKDIFIGKVYNKRRVTTFQNSITIRDIINLGKIDLDELIIRIHHQPKAKRILEASEPLKLNPERSDEIYQALLRTNLVTESYFKFDLLEGNHSDLIPQTIDAVNSGLSIFGVDTTDIPPLTEEQILDFDFNNFFSESLGQTLDGKLFFRHNNKILYMQKVHRTPIERCLGVDLIYNFIDEQRLVFIQYKCLTNEKKFYKSSDSHFPDELLRMKSIPGISECKNFNVDKRENLRLCGCPVYIKLNAREIKGRRKIPYGFYYPICIWDSLYSRQNKKYITLDDQPRITNEQFVELVKAGLLGSLPNQSKVIDSYLIKKSNDSRLKLIFEESKEEK